MSGSPTDLERSIVHTVCWFSVHGYPLTAFETWKWLWFPVRGYPLEEIVSALRSSPWLAARLQTDGSFFALKGDALLADLVACREERFVDATRKFQKLRRAARYLAALPTVLAVGAGNTLAWWHTRKESDIDLFVIAQPGTLWLTRLLAVLPFALFGRRPGFKAVDPFCFSFFVTTEALSLSSVRLFGGDPYLAYWVRSLVPMVDRDETFKRFHLMNRWCREILPHADPHAYHPTSARLVRPTRRIPPWITHIETLARRLQERRFPLSLRERANRDSSVVISDGMLKFHENDRREAFRDRFQELVMAYERDTNSP